MWVKIKWPSWLLTLDTRTGVFQPVAGPEHGLRGELVAIGTAPGSGRTLVVNAGGETFELLGTRARVLTTAPGPTSALLARIAAEPQRSVQLSDPATGRRRHFALDGWAVWRVAE